MAIEPDDAPFSVRITGETTGELWVGTFRSKKRLNHKSRLTKDQYRRELLGSTSGASTERALTTAEIISDLHIRLTDSPKWWQESQGGLLLEDDNILGMIYEKALEIEKTAAEEVKKKALEAQEKLREEIKAETTAEAK